MLVVDEVDTTNALYVTGSLLDTQVDFLIDSGSADTLLSTSVFNQIPRKERPTLSSPILDLVQANGSFLPNIGGAQMVVQIGKHKVRQKVVVADIEDEAILGTKFLFTVGGTVDFKLQQIITSDDCIQCDASHHETLARVKLTQTCRIPPGHEAILPGQIKRDPVMPEEYDRMEENEVGIIEPVAGRTLSDMSNPSFIVGHTLVDASNDVLPVRVLNPGDSEQVIKRGTTVAMLRRVSEESVGEVPQEPLDQPDELVVPEHLLDLYYRSIEHVPHAYHSVIAWLLREYADVFSQNDDDIGRTSMTKHDIYTRNADPRRLPPRRVPIAKREEIDKQIQSLLQRGLIEESDSPWASPIVLVKKKDGSQRLCVDYRKLNSVTVKDAFPIPRIDDTLDALAGATWFSTLDMSSGYWQVELTAEAAEKSSFVARSGLYKWKVMPFGLCNAPATFERLMEKVLSGLQWEIALIYLDDVIVFAKTIEEEIARLKIVFQRFRDANLKLKPKKCVLFQESVLYLGHRVSRDGVSTDPGKIRAVQEWPVPKNTTDVRSFIGLTSYYRKFVKGFADIARPLHKLMSKNVVFHWTDECQEAFQQLKTCLVSAPILAYPEAVGMFYLDTDASGTGLGGVLSQEQNGCERVIGYASRALTKEEQNYCATRRELLAVVEFLKHFRHYLYGRPVTVRTDHGSLRWLMNFKQPEGQLAHWMEMISEYDMKIVHRPGYQHKNADALSRRPCKQCGRMEESAVFSDGLNSQVRMSRITVRSVVNRIKVIPAWTP